MIKVSVVLLVVASIAGVSFAEAYSTGFEQALVADLLNEGWTWSSQPSFTTDQVHSGNQAIRLAPRVQLQRPLGEFGTLNLWVYDDGMIPAAAVANGGRWGLSKGDEAIAGFFYHRVYMDSGLAYGVNYGFGDDGITALWWPSATWMDAGDPGDPDNDPEDRSRGVAGWMNWEISYYPDGTIEINLLEDPNFPGFPKAFGENTIGVPVAPYTSSVEFANPASGGAGGIYLYGSYDVPGATSFGENIYIDDLTWTPAGPACIPGDANCDGDVNIDDFVVLKGNFGSGTTWAQGDFDGDGDVDIDDFVILKGNFGATSN